ncbi:MAG: hypothetical protein EA423_08680 [Phycisphaerales bacterium]|nr:MAG: hypothetical protein EA423_08680 [Phycisphaerales bacterium]
MTRPGDQDGLVRCVVWRPEGRQVPPDLVTALSRRGLAMREVDNRYRALASWIAAEAEAGERGFGVLILVEPEALQGVGGLVRAGDRFLMRRAVWVYDAPEGETKFRLRAVRSVEVEAWVEQEAGPVSEEVREATPVVPSPTWGPKLRLAGEGDGVVQPAPASSDHSEDEDATNDAGVLSEEELEMLLAEEPPQRPARGSG